MQLRYRPTGDIHVFNFPVDVKQALGTGDYEFIDGTSPLIIPVQKTEAADVQETEKPTPRIRRKRQEEEIEATNDN